MSFGLSNQTSFLEWFRFGSVVFVNLLGGRVERERGGERKSAALMIISKSFFAQNNFFLISIPLSPDLLQQILVVYPT